MNSVNDWLTSSGLTIALIIVVTWVVKKFGKLIIQRAIRKAITPNKFASSRDEKQREDTLISIINATASVVLWVVSIMLIVQELGVNIGPLLAGVSIIGVGIGFGSQSLVKDFVSGLFIIMENQYRVGDVINIAGESGKVEAITMRETILRNLDGHVIHVPNGIIEVAKNMTMEFSAINMNIGVGYNSDIKKVEKIINKIGVELSNDENWTKSILEAPHFIRVDNFGDSEVTIKILGKVEAGTQWAVAGELRSRIKDNFEKNKIEIPFPQRVIHQIKD